MKIDLQFIRDWADVDGWTETKYQPNIGLVQFRKRHYGVNVYLTKGTVAAWKGGKTQKFYKNLNQMQVADILQEPAKYV